MTFLNPLDALIPKIPFSFFADFWVWVTSEARGSVSVGFWGSCQLSPFLGEVGVRLEGSIDPPPPETKTRPPKGDGMTAGISTSGAPVYRAPPVPWVAGCTMSPAAHSSGQSLRPPVPPAARKCPPLHTWGMYQGSSSLMRSERAPSLSYQMWSAQPMCCTHGGKDVCKDGCEDDWLLGWL